MTKTFHIIHHGCTDGRRNIVGIHHETAAESAGAERAVSAAQTYAKVAACDCYIVVEQVGRGEIAVVGADGPVEA